MSKLTCGLCSDTITSPAGYVGIAEYQHPLTVKGARPICAQCRGLLVAADGAQLLIQSTTLEQGAL